MFWSRSQGQLRQRWDFTIRKNYFRQYYNAAENTYDTGSKITAHVTLNGDTKEELSNTNMQMLSVRDYLLDLEERIYNADFGDAFEDDNERKLVSRFCYVMIMLRNILFLVAKLLGKGRWKSWCDWNWFHWQTKIKWWSPAACPTAHSSDTAEDTKRNSKLGCLFDIDGTGCQKEVFCK